MSRCKSFVSLSLNYSVSFSSPILGSNYSKKRALRVMRSRVSVGKALVTNINGKALIRVFDTNEKEIKITISTIELEELEIAILYKS